MTPSPAPPVSSSCSTGILHPPPLLCSYRLHRASTGGVAIPVHSLRGYASIVIAVGRYETAARYPRRDGWSPMTGLNCEKLGRLGTLLYQDEMVDLRVDIRDERRGSQSSPANAVISEKTMFPRASNVSVNCIAHRLQRVIFFSDRFLGGTTLMPSLPRLAIEALTATPRQLLPRPKGRRSESFRTVYSNFRWWMSLQRGK